MYDIGKIFFKNLIWGAINQYFCLKVYAMTALKKTTFFVQTYVSQHHLPQISICKYEKMRETKPVFQK